MDSNQLSYIAGIIDGEGSIGIVRTNVKKEYGIRHGYSPSLCVVNTNLRLLEHLLTMTGFGKIIPRKKRSKKHKQCYIWYLNTRELKQLLALVKDFLVIKKNQAELALNMFKLTSATKKGRSSLTQEQKSLREVIYVEMKTLNQRGL